MAMRYLLQEIHIEVCRMAQTLHCVFRGHVSVDNFGPINLYGPQKLTCSCGMIFYEAK